jgi:ribonuclease HI
MSSLEIYIDGASKGNPGHGGIGVAIYSGGRPLKNISTYIGTVTNNIAEYTALVCALEEALLLKATDLQINTDSQLLARQVNGVYRVKHAGLIGLYERVMRLLSGFRKVTVTHIPREKNALADKLATDAVKNALKKGLVPGGKNL